MKLKIIVFSFFIGATGIEQNGVALAEENVASEELEDLDEKVEAEKNEGQSIAVEASSSSAADKWMDCYRECIGPKVEKCRKDYSAWVDRMTEEEKDKHWPMASAEIHCGASERLDPACKKKCGPMPSK